MNLDDAKEALDKYWSDHPIADQVRVLEETKVKYQSELSEAKATMIVNYGYPARAGQGKLIEETDSLHAMLVTVLTHYHEALKALQNQT